MMSFGSLRETTLTAILLFLDFYRNYNYNILEYMQKIVIMHNVQQIP